MVIRVSDCDVCDVSSDTMRTDRSARISRVATLALPKSFHRDHVGDRYVFGCWPLVRACTFSI